MTFARDPARSYAQIDDADLKRLGRAADADLELFFRRDPKLVAWRDRVRVVALAQGGAEHYLRGERGVWDLDVIVALGGEPSKQLRRPVVSWDWGESKFGRCPLDRPEFTGRAVDVKYWVIRDRDDSVEALRDWLAERHRKHPDPGRRRDLAQEPVILIRPRLGEVVWDPGAPPLPGPKAGAHRRPVGTVPA